jgi:hypothetical protein
MKIHAILLAAVLPLSASAITAPAAVDSDEGIRLSQSVDARNATLLGSLALDATYRPSAAPPLRLLDGLRFDLSGPPHPLDHGGAVDSNTRQILALLLGLVVGFGLGHLIAQDRGGFILFLVVDIAIIVATSLFSGLLWPPFGFIGGAAILLSHVFQGLDAYARAGGEKLIQLNRERAIRIASSESDPFAPAIATRAFALSF